MRIDHVPFGLVLRADGKKFQTRAGDKAERLIDLLEAAINKARELLATRNYTDITANELQQMAQILVLTLLNMQI